MHSDNSKTVLFISKNFEIKTYKDVFSYKKTVIVILRLQSTENTRSDLEENARYKIHVLNKKK